MDRQLFDTSDINSLSIVEKVLEYLFLNGITRENYNEHEEEISKLFSDESSYKDFNLFFMNSFKSFSAETTMRPEENIACFIHPRFHQVIPHSHDFFEIKFVLKGNATVFFEEEALVMHKSDLCLISPGTTHRTYIFDNETIMMNFAIRREPINHTFKRLFQERNFISDFLMRENLNNYSESDFLLFNTENDKNIESLVLMIYWNCNKKNTDQYSSLLTDSCMESIFLSLLIYQSGKNQLYEKRYVNNKKVYDILVYIKSHIENINFKDLSVHFNYSEAYLSRFIKNHTGQTFSDIIKTYRLFDATYLLRNSELNVIQIMQKIGYSGKTYFYEIFFEKYGVTPYEYRKKYGVNKKK